ncbi:hypothetical protein EXN66_Car019511 [Channa argus]|uniref:Uncharacterized protein n=1 Tax=Channa argus TaxID=215402 RepID=A0A6G1QNF6_CHAAH|nr:hypothetical protein EXN66_Car019511 [Channa argus]
MENLSEALDAIHRDVKDLKTEHVELKKKHCRSESKRPRALQRLDEVGASQSKSGVKIYGLPIIGQQGSTF